MSTLLIPIRVNARKILIGESCCDADLRFDLLPYFDKEKGVEMNGNRPYLAESIISWPFQNDNLYLPPGIHLHWSLPDFLCKTKYGSSDPTVFPAVPNRWFIRRSNANNPVKEWVVESDYIWENLPQGNYTRIPKSPTDHSNRPFTWMGRCLSYQEYLEEQRQRIKKNIYWKCLNKGPLTSLGWGSHVFDTFYPNCNSVFGMHDPEILSGETTYTVFGWYGSIEEEYLSLLQSGKDKIADIEQLKKFLSLDWDKAKGMPKQTVLCGQITIAEKQIQTTAAKADSVKTAMAPTPSGAIASILAAESGLDNQKKDIFEEQLAAILFSDKLNANKIDIGASLRELRHESGFNPIDSGWKWRISLEKNQAGIKDQSPNETTSTLPPEWANLLKLINEKQKCFDDKWYELKSLTDALYADWYRYMICCYPDAGKLESFPDQDVVMRWIAKSSYQLCVDAKLKLGTLSDPPINQLPYPIIEKDASLGGEVRLAYNQLLTAVKEANVNLSQNQWKIFHDAASRYYEPKPMSVVIAKSKNVSDKAFPLVELKPSLARFCGWTDFTPEVQASKGFRDICQEISQIKDLETKYNPNASIWHPFRAEWEAEYFPVATGNAYTKSNSKYAEDFITQNHELLVNEAEFSVNKKLVSNLAIQKSGSLYQGAAIISDSPAKDFLNRLDNANEHLKKILSELKLTPIEKEEYTSLIDRLTQSIKFLNDNDLIALTLNGFNDAMIQQQTVARMKLGDPLGFKEYRDFTDIIAKIIDPAITEGNAGKSPDPDTNFNPIRSGALWLSQLRLIDTFGRKISLVPEKVYTPSSMRINDQPNWIGLYPRFSQAARVNFRFVANAATSCEELANTDAVSHPDSNPILGWMMPNFLDHSLMFFDQQGKRLRASDLNGRLESNAPIESKELAEVIRWLSNQKTKNPDDKFLEAFMRNIEEAVAKIHPEDKLGQKSLSLLMGRPLALVKAQVSFQLMGRAAFDKSWDAFKQDLKGNIRDSRGFTAVKIPYHLGEYNQLNDGLVGYWRVANEQIKDANFQLNDSLSAVVNSCKEDTLTKDQKDALGRIKELMKNWTNAKGYTEDLATYLEKPGSTIRRIDVVQGFKSGGKLIWDTLKDIRWISEEEHDATIAHYLDAEALSASIDDVPSSFILLVDPYGEINLNCGILPVKSIKIPEVYFTDALNNMEALFLTAPIITSRNRLNISLPKEAGYHWSFIEKQINGPDLRTWEITFLKKLILDATFNDPDKTALNTCFAKGPFATMLDWKWLVALDQEQTIGVPQYETIKAGYEGRGLAEEQYTALLEVLAACIEKEDLIHPFSDRAAFGGPLAIKEGRLSLRHDSK